MQAVIDKLKALGADSVRDVEGIAERVTFPLPKSLAWADYIEGGHSLEEFLDDFPTVTRDLAIAALEQAKAHLIADARAA